MTSKQKQSCFPKIVMLSFMARLAQISWTLNRLLYHPKIVFFVGEMYAYINEFHNVLQMNRYVLEFQFRLQTLETMLFRFESKLNYIIALEQNMLLNQKICYINKLNQSLLQRMFF